jgi:hypothetical protein
MAALFEKLLKYKLQNLLLRAGFAITASIIFLAVTGIIVALVPVSLKSPVAIVLLLLLFLWGVTETFSTQNL